jgi:hypothetical protein
LLLALDYLDNQKFSVTPSIDLDSIYLNEVGTLRLSFALDRKRTDWRLEVKRVGEIFKFEDDSEMNEV